MQIQIENNIAYRDAEGYDAQLNTLDIYHAADKKEIIKRPVVLFLHGGNWHGGDKSCVNGRLGGMPRWFVLQGFLFVAANFRLAQNARSPEAGIKEMADDIAKAIKWLSINIRQYGGDSSKITLAGHSSGAHLAALVACDPSYLRGYRQTPEIIKRVIAMDVAHFDVPYALHVLDAQDVGIPDQMERRLSLLKVMGDSLEAQKQWSPAFHWHPHLKDIAFLLLSTGLQRQQEQTFSRLMNQRFCVQLQRYGVQATHQDFAQLNHADFLHHFEGEIATVIKSFLGTDR